MKTLSRWPGGRAESPAHTLLRIALAAGLAGSIASAAPAFARQAKVETGLTRACLFDARAAKMTRAAKRRYCGCVVGKFMVAHRRGEISAALIRRVMLIWRGKRSWPATPVGFSEFDYHAKSRCERATRA